MGVIYEPKGRAQEYSWLALNHYAGCGHGCTYCYVPAAVHKSKESFHRDVAPKANVIERLKAETPKYAGIDTRVLLCFSCDPYQPCERRLRLTREVIHIFRAQDIPFQVLTKAGELATQDFDLYGDRDAFAVTLTTTKDKLSRQLEPKAALPAERIEALRTAHDMGIETWVSLEPVIDDFQSLDLIAGTHEIVDLYKIGKLNHQQSDIDWRTFGVHAIELCEDLRKPYFIKADLARHLDGIAYHNTDNRCTGWRT